ncbi:hypothetical protein A4A49_03592 [Nicotiana attenuata]|uniref:RRM domain-containing protein n=1 Tax=Nicotiana attenuata TaxID=49451 RepID=A0A314LCK1_NICAT|nr:hypothetical protein A4A49_03592 [Nicotiana attenuata]
MDSSQKSSEYLGKSENSSNDFSALKRNLIPSIEAEEEKSCEDFGKCESSSNDDFPALVSNRPSIELEDEKSIVNTHQEAPKFSYAAMLANKTSNSPSSTLVKKVVRVAPSDNESHPRTGSNNVIVGPKEKVVCVRGLPKKVKAVDLIQALKKFGPVKIDSLQIKKFDLGGWSGTLKFQSADSARAAVEAGKIKFGEHVGFVSFKSAPLRYGTDMNRSNGRQRIEHTTIARKTPINTT